MSAKALSSRAIIGRFYNTLSQDLGTSWIPRISMLFQSDQSSETYKWLGMVPQLRLWTGPRSAKGLWDNGIEIINYDYEATLKLSKNDRRRDKTGQVMVRVDEMAQRANTHWAKLISELIINGEDHVCYDGEYFFDTDHTEGNNSTSQDNDLSIDISGLSAAVHGAAATAPSAEEAMLVILRCIEAIVGFKDNENEPMNENAKNFLVMTPISLLSAFLGGAKAISFGNGSTNLISTSDFNVTVVPNARLTWTAQVAVFNTDGPTSPFIIQEEQPLTMAAVAEGSELEFSTGEHHYGVETSRGAGYGMWQKACLATMT